MYEERTYRNQVYSEQAQASFQVVVKETDLFIRAGRDLADMAREFILHHRGLLETYVRQHAGFAETLAPWDVRGPSPRIVREMTSAGQQAGVGPMAAVAGAIAECVGKDLLDHTSDVIVENGGDLYLQNKTELISVIHAGSSPLSDKMAAPP